MSIISQADEAQAAYEAAIAAAGSLPHHPPPYRQTVSAVRNDLQGNPVSVIVGAVGYNAATQKALLETTDSEGKTTGVVSFDVDCVEAFSAALLALKG
jgi:hypothetical protein